MADPVFVDTAAFFAGIDRNDQYHGQAVAHAQRLSAARCRLLTTNHVVFETAMLVERKLSRLHAIRFLAKTVRDPMLKVIHADENLERKTVELYTRCQDQAYSVADCVSFVAMRSRRVVRCFTFDSHFSAMGFAVEPGR